MSYANEEIVKTTDKTPDQIINFYHRNLANVYD